MAIALDKLQKDGKVKRSPLKSPLAAISVGLVKDVLLLDLNYEEDSKADVDLNIAGDGAGAIVEIQGTAEGEMYTAEQLAQMTALGLKGIASLAAIQKESLAQVGIDLDTLVQRREEL